VIACASVNVVAQSSSSSSLDRHRRPSADASQPSYPSPCRELDVLNQRQHMIKLECSLIKKAELDVSSRVSLCLCLIEHCECVITKRLLHISYLGSNAVLCNAVKIRA